MIHFMAGAVRSLRLAPAPAANYPTARRRARGRRNPRANDARRLWPRYDRAAGSARGLTRPVSGNFLEGVA